MWLFALLVCAPAEADVVIGPVPERHFPEWSVRIEALDATPDFVVVAWDGFADEMISAHVSFTAAQPQAQVYREQNPRGGLASSRLFLVPAVDFTTWQDETGLEVRRQRGVCAARGEGCVNLRSFVPHYASPPGAIDCGVEFKVSPSGPTDVPVAHVFTFHLDEASTTTCKMSPVGAQIPPTPTGGGGCASVSGQGISALGAVALLVGLSRRAGSSGPRRRPPDSVG